MLKKATESSSMVSYMDTSITISENKYVTTTYDKRDDCNFYIVNFPYVIFPPGLPMEYIYHSWSELQGYVLNIVPLWKGIDILPLDL